MMTKVVIVFFISETGGSARTHAAFKRRKIKMNMKDFQQKIERALKEYGGEDSCVRISAVRKNNGIQLTGVSMFKDGSNITPTVYLEDYLQRYEEGESFGTIMGEIISVLERSGREQHFDLNAFTDWKKAQKRVVYKLVNAEMNREQLAEIPHLPFLDMAIVFYYLLGEDEMGNATILICNSHIAQWNVTAEELYACAHSNTRRLLPVTIQNMEELMREVFLEDMGKKMREEKCREGQEGMADSVDEMLRLAMEGRESVPMYVMTNKNRYFGAACLLYPGVLRCFAERLDSNLFILPSSIHEVIILEDDGCTAAGQLQEMVRQVNDTQVAAEEVLSDTVYYYERHKDELGRVSIQEIAEAG